MAVNKIVLDVSKSNDICLLTLDSLVLLLTPMVDKGYYSLDVTSENEVNLTNIKHGFVVNYSMEYESPNNNWGNTWAVKVYLSKPLNSDNQLYSPCYFRLHSFYGDNDRTKFVVHVFSEDFFCFFRLNQYTNYNESGFSYIGVINNRKIINDPIIIMSKDINNKENSDLPIGVFFSDTLNTTQNITSGLFNTRIDPSFIDIACIYINVMSKGIYAGNLISLSTAIFSPYDDSLIKDDIISKHLYLRLRSHQIMVVKYDI